MMKIFMTKMNAVSLSALLVGGWQTGTQFVVLLPHRKCLLLLFAYMDRRQAQDLVTAAAAVDRILYPAANLMLES